MVIDAFCQLLSHLTFSIFWGYALHRNYSWKEQIYSTSFVLDQLQLWHRKISLTFQMRFKKTRGTKMIYCNFYRIDVLLRSICFMIYTPTIFFEINPGIRLWIAWMPIENYFCSNTWDLSLALFESIVQHFLIARIAWWKESWQQKKLRKAVLHHGLEQQTAIISI